MIHAGRAGSYRTAAHHILFLFFLLFDSWTIYIEKSKEISIYSRWDPTNLLVMVGWNTHTRPAAKTLSLSRPAKDIRRDIASMTTEEEKKVPSGLSISAAPIDRYATSPNSFFFFLFKSEPIEILRGGVYFLTLGPVAPDERNVTVLHYG